MSAVFSSKIDGEAIELDAFIRIKCLGVNFLPDYTRKIDDLYEAYLFAQGSPFVKIHPFDDGNGRMARLEKWFLAQKAGEKPWFIQSQKHYYHHHATCYANIRRLGLEYDLLNYDEAMPFLLMLAEGAGDRDGK